MIRQIGDFLAYASRHPIGRRAPLGTASRYLGWQLKSRVARGPFVEQWIEGTRLSVERGMTGATGNLDFGLHEFPDMAFVLHMLREGDLFLDIGANIGSYTVLAAGVAGARCWSFEPARETLPLLRENIRLNGIEQRVTLFDCALGDRADQIVFTTGEGCVNRVAGPDYQGPTQKVAVRRLDEVVGDACPLLIKVDVEGHEQAVFAGAEAVLAKPSLRAIELETLSQPVAEQLARHGFKRRFYRPFDRSLDEQPSDNVAHNLLFVRDEAFIAERLRSAPQRTIAGVRL